MNNLSPRPRGSWFDLLVTCILVESSRQLLPLLCSDDLVCLRYAIVIASRIVGSPILTTSHRYPAGSLLLQSTKGDIYGDFVREQGPAASGQIIRFLHGLSPACTIMSSGKAVHSQWTLLMKMKHHSENVCPFASITLSAKDCQAHSQVNNVGFVL